MHKIQRQRKKHYTSATRFMRVYIPGTFMTVVFYERFSALNTRDSVTLSLTQYSRAYFSFSIYMETPNYYLYCCKSRCTVKMITVAMFLLFITKYLLNCILNVNLYMIFNNLPNLKWFFSFFSFSPFNFQIARKLTNLRIKYKM